MRRRIITVVVDILAGVAVLVLFAVAADYLHVGASLSTAVVTLAVLSLAAGVLRGRGMPSSAWLKGVLVGSGCILVSLLLGWGQMAHSVLAVFLVAEGFFIICGVQARRLWTARSVGNAVAMLLAPLGALVIVALMAIPALTWSISTRQMTQPAPAISFTALDGDIVSSPAFRGRVGGTRLLGYLVSSVPGRDAEAGKPLPPVSRKPQGRLLGRGREQGWRDPKEGPSVHAKLRLHPSGCLR
jgi:hypothetical protein